MLGLAGCAVVRIAHHDQALLLAVHGGVVEPCLEKALRPARMRPALGHDWRWSSRTDEALCANADCYAKRTELRTPAGLFTYFTRGRRDHAMSVRLQPDWRRCYGKAGP